MGSANSVQHQGARQALRQKLKEVAQIARLLEENSVAVSLEALSESSDFSIHPTVLNVRKDLINASTTPLNNPISRHFQQLGLNEEQIERLIPLVQAWERQKSALVGIALQEAPHWEKDYELCRGAREGPNTPSTAIARAWRLICEVEDTAVSAMRRKLLLVSIYEAVETEANKLSEVTKRLCDINKQLDEVARELSRARNHPEMRLRAERNAAKRRRTKKADELQRRETSLTEERRRLNDEIGRYPESNTFRGRVIKRVLNESSGDRQEKEEERKKEEERFTSHARLGKRYRRFRPLGILFFLGKPYRFERTTWTDGEYDAMLSYWEHVSGIYNHCQRYTPLLERLKQRYWDPLSTSPMAQEANAPGLILGASPATRDSSSPPEGWHDHLEIPQVSTTSDSSPSESAFGQNSTNSPPDTSAIRRESTIRLPLGDSASGQESVVDPPPDNPVLGQQNIVDLSQENSGFGQLFLNTYEFAQQNITDSPPDNSTPGRESVVNPLPDNPVPGQQNIVDLLPENSNFNQLFLNTYAFAQQNITDSLADNPAPGRESVVNSPHDNPALGQQNIAGLLPENSSFDQLFLNTYALAQRNITDPLLNFYQPFMNTYDFGQESNIEHPDLCSPQSLQGRDPANVS